MQAQELLKYKNWVVVGDVLNPDKYASKILKALEAADFSVEGVHPKDSTGIIYKSLKDISYKIDVIDLCINPIMGVKILEEASELGIDKVLIQPGAGSQDILNYCKDNGIAAVDGCVLVELGKEH